MPDVRITHAWPALLVALAIGCKTADPPPAQDFPTDSVGLVDPPRPAAARLLSVGKSGPVDQGGFHPDFLEFRGTLRRAVELRDTSALFALVSPDFKASFGGESGVQGLRDVWRLGSGDPEFWTVLADVLDHGGRFNGDDQFTAPWTFGGLPESLDAFSHLIIRGEDVPVRERPDAESPEIGRLGYDVVQASTEQAPEGWRGIALADGGVGYVEAAQVRGPNDHRAMFERRGGRWWFVAFLAGD